MARRNVTQTQLAQVLHVAQPAVSKRLRGLTPFDANEIGALAEFFEVSPAELLGERLPNPGDPAGVNLRVVQELMRHKSLATTAGYLGVDANEKAEAIRRLAA